MKLQRMAACVLLLLCLVMVPSVLAETDLTPSGGTGYTYDSTYDYYTITASGVYRLTDNIDAKTGRNAAIRVNAPDVIIDGQYFTINGGGSTGGVAVNATQSNVSVKNLIVENPYTTNSYSGAIYATGNVENSIVRDLTGATGGERYGIYAEGSVVNCTVEDFSFSAGKLVAIYGAVSVLDSTVQNAENQNSGSSTSLYGILTGADGTVSKANVQDIGGAMRNVYGISANAVNESIVSNVTASGYPAYGIWATGSVDTSHVTDVKGGGSTEGIHAVFVSDSSVSNVTTTSSSSPAYGISASGTVSNGTVANVSGGNVFGIGGVDVTLSSVTNVTGTGNANTVGIDAAGDVTDSSADEITNTYGSTAGSDIAYGIRATGVVKDSSAANVSSGYAAYGISSSQSAYATTNIFENCTVFNVTASSNSAYGIMAGGIIDSSVAFVSGKTAYGIYSGSGKLVQNSVVADITGTAPAGTITGAYGITMSDDQTSQDTVISDSQVRNITGHTVVGICVEQDNVAVINCTVENILLVGSGSHSNENINTGAGIFYEIGYVYASQNLTVRDTTVTNVSVDPNSGTYTNGPFVYGIGKATVIENCTVAEISGETSYQTIEMRGIYTTYNATVINSYVNDVSSNGLVSGVHIGQASIVENVTTTNIASIDKNVHGFSYHKYASDVNPAVVYSNVTVKNINSDTATAYGILLSDELILQNVDVRSISGTNAYGVHQNYGNPIEYSTAYVNDSVSIIDVKGTSTSYGLVGSSSSIPGSVQHAGVVTKRPITLTPGAELIIANVSESAADILFDDSSSGGRPTIIVTNATVQIVPSESEIISDPASGMYLLGSNPEFSSDGGNIYLIDCGDGTTPVLTTPSGSVTTSIVSPLNNNPTPINNTVQFQGFVNAGTTGYAFNTVEWNYGDANESSVKGTTINASHAYNTTGQTLAWFNVSAKVPNPTTSTNYIQIQRSVNFTVLPPGDAPEWEVNNTVTDGTWSAAVPAEVVYEITPAEVSSVTAPEISNKAGNTLKITNATGVAALSGGGSRTVTVTVNPDGSITVTGDLTGVTGIEINFTGRKLGDVTNNGNPNMLDALTIAQHSVGNLVLDDTQIFYGDVTGNGNPNMLDALTIAQYSVGNLNENYEIGT